MWKHIRNLSIIVILLALGLLFYLSRPDVAQLPEEEMVGKIDVLPDARDQIIPTMNVAKAKPWAEGEKPDAASGLKVERFAEQLDHPRGIFVLPNGDVLISETNRPKGGSGGIRGMMTSYLSDKAGNGGPSANRISILRDANNDGRAEMKGEFITGLKSPFGIALIGDTLYVANTDAVLAFPYSEGDTKITAPGKKLFDVPATQPNLHWTRNLIASPDGKTLYVAVGANSNIGENGVETEKGRAQVIEYDLEKDKKRTFASGMRNPVGMAFAADGELWAVVNERDGLGSDVPPDYLARLTIGDDFGWPHHYWGGYTDFRVKPREPETRQYEKRPEFALAAHTGPLGLVFSNGMGSNAAKLGAKFADGAFIARHGSWNRSPKAGYDLVFVKFKGGAPAENKLVNVLTGFLDEEENARGRPTMLAVASDGALLLTDDISGIVWRVSAAQ